MYPVFSDSVIVKSPNGLDFMTESPATIGETRSVRGGRILERSARVWPKAWVWRNPRIRRYRVGRIKGCMIGVSFFKRY
jgi:hypothetical protein